MGTLATVITVIDALSKYVPQIIQTGTDMMPFAESLYQQLSGKVLTDAERAELRTRVDAAYERAVEPLPPPRPGDPDYKNP